MGLISVGTMAFDAIETPFGKVDQIVGGSGTYVAYAASNFVTPIQQISIIGYDFPQEELDELKKRARRAEASNIETRVIESSKTVKRLENSADRLLLPPNLREYAGLEKDIVLTSGVDKIEIWSKSSYQEFFDSYSPNQFSSLAQKVMGGEPK